MFGSVVICLVRLNLRASNTLSLVSPLGPFVFGSLVAWRLEPFFNRVARQPRALGDLAVGELLAQLHAIDLACHFHGDHLLALLLKYSTGQLNTPDQFSVGVNNQSSDVHL